MSNECGACEKDFGSVAAFDRHRVGNHAYTAGQGLRMDPPREDGRRCLSEREIASLLDGRGAPVFERNVKGLWSITRDLAHGRALRPDAGEADET